MEDLTPRQAEVLEFIREFYREQGMPPTVRELGDHFGIASSSMFDHLSALQRKGFLKRGSRKSRHLELADGYLPPEAFSIPDSLSIPIVGQVAAGSPILADENLEGRIRLDKDFGKPGEIFALRVRGESMINAHILDGDLVMVQPTSEVRNGDIIVALIGDEATVKRFFREKGTVRLQPENPAMEPIMVSPRDNEFRVLGKVTAVLRQCN